MHYRIFSILTAFICLFGCVLTSAAQDANGTDDDAAKPVILYSGAPKKGRFCLERAEPIVYSHGEYFALGDALGRFGWSVRRKRRKQGR